MKGMMNKRQSWNDITFGDSLKRPRDFKITVDGEMVKIEDLEKKRLLIMSRESYARRMAAVDTRNNTVIRIN